MIVSLVVAIWLFVIVLAFAVLSGIAFREDAIPAFFGALFVAVVSLALGVLLLVA